jgi:YD repeat-containing protein
MLTQTDGKASTTIFEYNAANKVIRRVDPGGRSGTPGNYTYDAAKTESYISTIHRHGDGSCVLMQNKPTWYNNPGVMKYVKTPESKE